MGTNFDVQILEQGDFAAAQAFYETVGYFDPITPGSIVVAARDKDHRIVGVVRLCREEGVQILRGMMLAPSVQRQGLGSRMLQVLKIGLDPECCYCLPHDWLEGFYGQIGFRIIAENRLPPHLLERLQRYRAGPYPHIIAMKTGLPI